VSNVFKVYNAFIFRAEQSKKRLGFLALKVMAL
jgi:hypothetical protein